MERIYLAGPYSHPDEHEESERLISHCVAAGLLMKQGHAVFSPAAHGGLIAPLVDRFPKDFEFRMRQCETHLRHWATAVIALPLDGWEASRGLRHELELALELGFKPVFGAKLRKAVETYRAGYRKGHGFDGWDELLKDDLMAGETVERVMRKEPAERLS